MDRASDFDPVESDNHDTIKGMPDQPLKRTAMVFRVHGRHVEFMSTYSCSFPFLSFPFLSFRDDCDHRGWYDSPQSALRPHSDVTQCALILLCMQISLWVGGV